MSNQNSIHPNPTEGPYQPLLLAPGVLLRCGMRDAHSRPLVGRRDGDGVIRASWRESPSIAWSRELIEMARTGNSYAALIFDCDSRASVEIAASAEYGARDWTPIAARMRDRIFAAVATTPLRTAADLRNFGGPGRAD